MGETGWQVFARSLQDKHIKKQSWVGTSKQGLSEAGKDDLMDIWDAVERGFGVLNAEIDLYHFGGFPVQGYGCGNALCVDKSKYDWDRAWTRLKKISTMTEDRLQRW